MMPLIVKDFSWHQTADVVSILVNIKGIKADKTDILTSNNYIRIHYHPYIFEVFLLEEVEDIVGSCRIDEGSSVVLIQLPKVSGGREWITLENKELDRLQKKVIREAAVSTSHKRHEEEAKVRAATRQEQKQMTVREQIRLDQEERFRIAEIKRVEGSNAVSGIQEWSSRTKLIPGKTSSYADIPAAMALQNHPPPFQDRLAKGDSSSSENKGEVSLEELMKRGPSSVTILSSEDEDEEEDANYPQGATNSTRISSSKLRTRRFNKDACKYLEDKAIWMDPDDSKKKLSSPTGFCNNSGNIGDKAGHPLKEVGVDEMRNVPGIRQTAHISVKFTPRDFITPSRESTAPEEQEWLKKQAEARRKSGFNDADLRPEERDPSWLLDKGMALMKTECHLGAVSAFSLGMKLAPKMPELYVERARAQLAQRNFIKTVEDASQALELLTPKVPANSADRLKCHVCRGTAFQELQLNCEAIMDLKEAVILSPDDLVLATQLKDLQGLIDQKELELDSSDED